MAKYKPEGYYIQLTRALTEPQYSNLSPGAKWLFVTLAYNEHRFTTGRAGGEDFFFRSDADLARDAGYSITTLKKYKKELKNTDLIKTWAMHWVDPDTGKKSEKKVTAYQLLK